MKATATLTALALGLSGAALLAGPARRPVFRSDVEAVNLTVTISDGPRFVSDLGPRDFLILEDGVPQELSVFAQEDTPLSLAILLDTSLSMEAKMDVAKEAAVRFVRSLRPHDTAQIVYFNERVVPAQEFTSDRQLLEKAILSARAGGGTALYTAVYICLKDLARDRRQGEVRRRAIVVLSDGEDTASSVTDDQVLALARQSDIGVYGISLRGAADKSALPGPAALSSRFFISALSRETGGEAHFPRSISQLAGVYEHVLDELRSQYSLGYVSSNPRRDGRWRSIEVRLLDRPGLRIRHKPGYHARAHAGQREGLPNGEADHTDHHR